MHVAFLHLQSLSTDGFSRRRPEPQAEKITNYFVNAAALERATGVTTLPATVPADVCATSPCSPEASGWETT